MACTQAISALGVGPALLLPLEHAGTSVGLTRAKGMRLVRAGDVTSESADSQCYSSSLRWGVKQLFYTVFCEKSPLDVWITGLYKPWGVASVFKESAYIIGWG